MLSLLRIARHVTELAVLLPRRGLRLAANAVPFNPRLGPLRHVATAAVLYIVFALLLVYVIAPIRAYTGGATLAQKLGYDAERWLATAIYDPKGNFVGTFDLKLDSLRDVNYTDDPIAVGDYVANPDHKSIPVRDVPDDYWRCLSYHEDRYLGGPLNPFGIDLTGVLKIPLTTVTQSIARKRLTLGVGGSTLPMQFARVIYKTPPSADEGAIGKLKRKMREWWLAPVIYRELTKGGDDTRLKQWAANHIWLAQRTGGQALHGVEVTSRIVFGKEAKDLTTAEQFVLASAVNKPIILLEGNDKLNEVRLDRWRYITEVRARTCAEKLITDETQQKAVVFELMALAGGPPDPKVRPALQQALERFAPEQAKRAQANPVIRANVLMPSQRFGLREEMKQRYGFGWRDYVRGITTTFDVESNLAFKRAIEERLAKLDAEWKTKLDPAYTLDPAAVSDGKTLVNVTVVAADAAGRIVRYYDTGETASYYGSWPARSSATGLYDPKAEGRMVASTGKMLAAIAIANEGRDSVASLYTDTDAPTTGLETCQRGGGQRAPRRAIVAFACSLNAPLLQRTAELGQPRIAKLIDGFGFAMPPISIAGGTPPSTAIVMGQIAGSPRTVHHMSGVVLAALIGQAEKPLPLPSLISAYDYTFKGDNGIGTTIPAYQPPVPRALIRKGANPLLRALLEAPLCYRVNGTPTGTLKTLSHWCSNQRGDLKLHFAKTGTQVAADRDATVDAWITGGLQFTTGAAYSYVVVVGTGSANKPFATALHAGQVAAPLLDDLLTDLATDAKRNPAPNLLPPAPRRTPTPIARNDTPRPRATTVHREASAPRTVARAPDRSPAEEQLRALNPN